MLAELTEKIGDRKESLVVYRKALALRRDLVAGPKADAEARLAIAVTLLKVGQSMAAIADTTGALLAYEDARDLASSLEALAQSHMSVGVELQDRMGKPAEALAAFREALAIRQKLAEANPTVIGKGNADPDAMDWFEKARALALLATLVERALIAGRHVNAPEFNSVGS